MLLGWVLNPFLKNYLQFHQGLSKNIECFLSFSEFRHFRFFLLCKKDTLQVFDAKCSILKFHLKLKHVAQNKIKPLFKKYSLVKSVLCKDYRLFRNNLQRTHMEAVCKSCRLLRLDEERTIVYNFKPQLVISASSEAGERVTILLYE